MRYILLVSLLAATAAWAGEGTITIPWPEFKTLYTQQLRQSLLPKKEQQPAPLYTLSHADYDLTVSGETFQGTLTLDGQVLRGHPKPIALLGDELALTEILQAEGASLMAGDEGYSLRIDSQDRFRIALRFLGRLSAERRTRRVRFRVPRALSNTVRLTLPEGIRLLEPPGLARGDGRYVLTPREALSFRLSAEGHPTGATPVVDTFSRIGVSGAKYLLTTWLLATEGGAAGFELQLPAGARLVDSSLPAAALRDAGPDTLRVTPPAQGRQPMVLRLELPAREGPVRVRLPTIAGNLGREGELALDQPEDGSVALVGEGYRRGLPVAGLPEALRAQLGALTRYDRAPRGEIALALTRYDAVASPEVVLDTLHVYTSFTENGRTLTMLHLKMPREAGDKLVLAAVPGAEIWSLRVDGVPRRLYAQSGDHWVIPLSGRSKCTVELAYLSKSARLGLSGRLELSIPATGISARRLHLAVGLEPRVELVSVEGDLQPAKANGWPRVAGFTGTAYHFLRPYYRGEPITAAVYYKEPVVSEQR